MSTLVETITEEPTLALAKHLADLSLKPEEQSALVSRRERLLSELPYVNSDS
jgi:hypothetical protein